MHVSRLHSDLLWHLDVAAGQLKKEKTENWTLREGRNAFEDVVRRNAEIEIETERDNGRRLDRTLTETKATYENRISVMGRTVGALQQMVKTISNETGQVRDGDMAMQMLKLRHIVDSLETEIVNLRPLKAEAKALKVRVMIRDNDLQKARLENDRLRKDLGKRERLIKMLVEQRNSTLTDDEYKLVTSTEERAAEGDSDGEGGDHDHDNDEEKEPTSVLCVMCNRRLDEMARIGTKVPVEKRLPCEAFRLMLPKLGVHKDGHGNDASATPDENEADNGDATTTTAAAAAAASKRNLLASEDKNKKSDAAAAAAEEKKGSNVGSDDDDDDDATPMPEIETPATQKVRHTLNNPRMPARVRDRALDAVWVVRSMRALLHAKAVDDAAVYSANYAIESGVGSKRTRFPEFVYSWFTPPPEYIASVCTNVKSLPSNTNETSKAFTTAGLKDEAALLSLYEEADELRWALYYGVKMLAQRGPPMPEAVLFWCLLDETYHEDYSTFYCFCIQTVRAMCGKSLDVQWGPTYHPFPPPSQYILQLRTEGPGAAAFPLEAGAESNILGPLPRTMWIAEEDAVTVTHFITSRALQEDREVVLRALKAIAITAQGRMPNVFSNKVMCVDLHLFLKLLLHTYRSDQTNRVAAVRLCFESAAAGRTSQQALLYAQQRGYGRKVYRAGASGSTAGAAGASFYSQVKTEKRGHRDDEDEGPAKAPPLDILQFQAVCLSLAPNATLAEISQMYREAHYDSKGNVNYEAFFKVADRNQFFSRALLFPSFMHSAANNNHKYAPNTRYKLGSIVHMNHHLMRQTFDKIEERLPANARAVYSACRREVSDTIQACTKFGSIEGYAPLAAYRRLLQLSLQLRVYAHESGRELREYVKEKKADNDSEMCTHVFSELSFLAKIVSDFDPEQVYPKFDIFKQGYSVSKMVLFWRQKVALVQGPPIGVTKLLRCGYLSGRGDIRSRRVTKPLTWVINCIANIFTFKVGHDARQRRLGKETQVLARVVYDFFTSRFGIPSVAERFLHDFFYSLRSCVEHIARARCFGILIGLPLAREAQKIQTQFIRRATMHRQASSVAEAEDIQGSDNIGGNSDNSNRASADSDLSNEKILESKQASVFYLQTTHTVLKLKQSLVVFREKYPSATRSEELVYARSVGMARGLNEGIEKPVVEAASFSVNSAAPAGAAPTSQLPPKQSSSSSSSSSSTTSSPVPQLFPVTVNPQEIWLEPVDFLVVCAEVTFHEITSFELSDRTTVEHLKNDLISAIKSSKHRSSDTPPGVAEVDEFLWYCLLMWANIVRMRIMNVRRRIEFFGDDIVLRDICKSLHTVDKWKRMCAKNLNCRGTFFERVLTKREQDDVFIDTYCTMLRGVEESFPALTGEGTMDVRKLISTFERSIIPLVTVDLGGAAAPLCLYDEGERKKNDEIRALKRSHTERLLKEAEEAEVQTHAGRARAKQKKSMGAGEGGAIEDVVFPENTYHEIIEGASLIDAWDSYDSVIMSWINEVKESKSVLNGESFRDAERFSDLGLKIDGLRTVVESLKQVDQKQAADKKYSTAREHLRHAQTLFDGWASLRDVLSEVHLLANSGKLAGKNTTVEFLNDSWSSGSPYNFSLYSKVPKFI